MLFALAARTSDLTLHYKLNVLSAHPCLSIHTTLESQELIYKLNLLFIPHYTCAMNALVITYMSQWPMNCTLLAQRWLPAVTFPHLILTRKRRGW